MRLPIVAALKGITFDKSGLQGMQSIGLGQPFDGRDFGPVL